MNQKDYLLNLREVIGQLDQAKKHLKISFKRCQNIRSKGPYSEEDLIDYEALTSRFARATDILIHKVYRSIDAVEMVEGGTLIDVINRADKREIIDSVAEMRLIKDLRNDIAHEYLTERLCLLHDEVFVLVPKLLDLIQRATNYAKKFL